MSIGFSEKIEVGFVTTASKPSGGASASPLAWTLVSAGD